MIARYLEEAVPVSTNFERLDTELGNLGYPYRKLYVMRINSDDMLGTVSALSDGKPGVWFMKETEGRKGKAKAIVYTYSLYTKHNNSPVEREAVNYIMVVAFHEDGEYDILADVNIGGKSRVETKSSREAANFIRNLVKDLTKMTDHEEMAQKVKLVHDKY